MNSMPVPCTASRNALGGDRFIFVILTQTNGLIPSVIRAFGGTQFNHAAIAFDAQLIHTYSFARLKYRTPFVGGIVHEYLSRYTLCGNAPVPTAVFAVRVSAEEYERIKQTVRQILADHDYMYNLLSVASYPLTGGFRTHKAFSCSEFVAALLDKSGISLPAPAYHCRPDDIYSMLSGVACASLVYSGDIRGCMYRTPKDKADFREFCAPFEISMISDTLFTLYELARRIYAEYTHRTGKR